MSEEMVISNNEKSSKTLFNSDQKEEEIHEFMRVKLNSVSKEDAR